MAPKQATIKTVISITALGISIPFYAQSSIHGAEILMAVCLAALIWVYLPLSRVLVVVWGALLVTDMLLLRMSTYALIFVVAFLIVLYELCDFLNFHSVETDVQETHDEVMTAHLKYIALLFFGCSIIPAMIALLAQVVGLQIGQEAALTILLYAGIVLTVLALVKLIPT
ncbi:MAG: hypothetical protein HXS41_11480 [Theionarchaea archaeon]|nr:hypothetical protein [Theionarchaea archaeon]MBU7000033.1 hypothetical protein [Theionarchaea archaeon]MBU7021669.1 hypothetical protein [Theionarchaea archaeon]MBU7034683.1 hypothetical protein [Theionarchaea archaeon]MBU7039344.1 hypothetical protein [Theionarchaea archaeon]